LHLICIRLFQIALSGQLFYHPSQIGQSRRPHLTGFCIDERTFLPFRRENPSPCLSQGGEQTLRVCIRKAFSTGGLNPSPKLGAYTPRLSNGSSTRGLSHLFLRAASGLDAFSLYPRRRGFPAARITTGTPEAAQARSFRTSACFLSDGKHPQQI